MTMCSHPKDVHREVLRRESSQFSDVPSWYAVWLGQPHDQGAVLLGRTERLPRPRYWRVFPVTGEPPQVHRGWFQAMSWLLQVREGHEKATDRVHAEESESVRPVLDIMEFFDAETLLG